jgi:hypothetical protein
MQKNENKQKHDDDDCAEKNCKQPNSGYWMNLFEWCEMTWPDQRTHNLKIWKIHNLKINSPVSQLIGINHIKNGFVPFCSSIIRSNLNFWRVLLSFSMVKLEKYPVPYYYWYGVIWVDQCQCKCRIKHKLKTSNNLIWINSLAPNGWVRTDDKRVRSLFLDFKLYLVICLDQCVCKC